MVEGGMILGNFGTARETWIADKLAAVVPPLLRERPDAALMLVGRDSPALRSRLLEKLRSCTRACTPQVRSRPPTSHAISARAI